MRRSTMAVGCVALLAVACADPVRDPDGDSSRAEEESVLAAEDAYVAAELDRDETALRRLVDDRFVMNSADGTTSGKDALIRAVLGMNMTGQAISERSVLVEGDLAIVFGTTEIRTQPAGGAEQVATFRYTSTYVKRKDDWRMLALHMAPRPPGP